MIVLALVAAALWGSGNFSMGLAARDSSPRATVLVGFGVGLASAVLFLVLQRPVLVFSGFGSGAIAGLCQGLGWMSFARSMVRGRVALVAPTAACTTTLLLYVVELADGKTISFVATVGLVLALVAITLLSWRSAGDARRSNGRATERGVPEAVIAGTLFTCQALALVDAGTSSSSLVLVGSGLGVVLLLSATALARPIPRSHLRNARVGAGLGGAAIFVGDLSYLYALGRGTPVLATVIAQLHPVVTAVLAGAILRDHPTKLQTVGIVFALLGVALISIG